MEYEIFLNQKRACKRTRSRTCYGVLKKDDEVGGSTRMKCKRTDQWDRFGKQNAREDKKGKAQINMP